MDNETLSLLSGFNVSTNNNSVPFSHYEKYSFVQDIIVSGNGPVGNNGFLIIWDKFLLEKRNDDYMTPLFLSDVFLIGTDGGDMAFGITSAKEFIEVPFLDMRDESVRFLSDSFKGFIKRIADGDY